MSPERVVCIGLTVSLLTAGAYALGYSQERDCPTAPLGATFKESAEVGGRLNCYYEVAVIRDPNRFRKNWKRQELKR